MNLNILKCPACGGQDRLEKKAEGGAEFWHCAYCNNKFTESTIEQEYKKLEITIKSGLGSVIDDALVRERTEKYYNLRSMLWDKINARFTDSASVISICRDIKSIAPHDFLAEFFELANSGNDDDTAEYIQRIDVEENSLLIDIVLDFLIKSMREKYITPTALLLERCGSIFSPTKRQDYLTRFEAEAKKVQNGIYEVGLQRDVFLAYSSKDLPAVIEVLDIIEASGLTCFAAFRNLQHGKDAVANYEKALHEAIDNCSIFVFVSSVNSRSFNCDAYKKEISYIKNQELQRFPGYRSYEQIPEKNKKLRIEYRLDNTPTPVIDKSIKEFFSGLTYAETHDQLLSRLGECMEILNSPFIDDEKHRVDALEEELNELKKKQAEFSESSTAKKESSSEKSSKSISDRLTETGEAIKTKLDDLKNSIPKDVENSPKFKNWVMFFVCLLFGYLGVHKFVEGKIRSGLIYMFTLGLIYVGWLTDAYKYLKNALDS